MSAQPKPAVARSPESRGADGARGDGRGLSASMVIAAVVSVQTGSAIAVGLFEELGSGGVVLLRIAFAAVILMVLWRPGVRGLSRMTVRDVALFGLALAGMNLCFYAAIDRIPLGLGVTLEFVGPLGVAITASRRALDFAWVGLATAGIALLAPGLGDSLDVLGALLALAAGAFWGAYILLAQRVGSVLPGGGGLAIAMCVAASLALPPGLIGAGDALLEPALLAGGLAVAILSSAIPYSLELEALRRIPRGTFGVLMSLEPGVAALLGFVILGQGLSVLEAIAIALVVTASAGALSSANTRVVDA